MEFRIWIDDIRKCPFPGVWITCKSYEEAITAIQTCNSALVEIWFDNDLYAGSNPSGESIYSANYVTPKTGYDIAKWLKEQIESEIINPPSLLGVHSMNEEWNERITEKLRSIPGYSTENVKSIRYEDLTK